MPFRAPPPQDGVSASSTTRAKSIKRVKIQKEKQLSAASGNSYVRTLSLALYREPGATRTHGPRLKRALLYQLSYGLSHFVINIRIFFWLFKLQQVKITSWRIVMALGGLFNSCSIRKPLLPSLHQASV
jgi:hypothetical protein